MRTLYYVLASIVLLVALWQAMPAAAQPAAAPPAAASGAQQGGGASAESSHSFFEIVFAGGLTGFLIMIVLFGLSIGAVALVIEHLLTIREPVLMPPGLGDHVRGLLLSGNLNGAEQYCHTRPSFLAFVLRAGLSEAEGGWSAVEKAMEDASAEQAARLLRKVEFLSVIGNIAPMVGLLGTVTGMIFAFREVAESQGAARAAQLAEGIYQALVTTVAGLLIAIPALAAFAIFRNRVDQLVAEAAYMAQHSLGPLKRARVIRKAAPVPTPPPLEGAT